MPHTRTHPYDDTREVTTAPAKSLASLLAIAAALGSFVLSFQGREMWALLAAFAAIGLGVAGMFKAASPRVSGGILSFLAAGLGAFAVIVALLALLF